MQKLHCQLLRFVLFCKFCNNFFWSIFKIKCRITFTYNYITSVIVVLCDNKRVVSWVKCYLIYVIYKNCNIRKYRTSFLEFGVAYLDLERLLWLFLAIMQTLRIRTILILSFQNLAKIFIFSSLTPLLYKTYFSHMITVSFVVTVWVWSVIDKGLRNSKYSWCVKTHERSNIEYNSMEIKINVMLINSTYSFYCSLNKSIFGIRLFNAISQKQKTHFLFWFFNVVKVEPFIEP